MITVTNVCFAEAIKLGHGNGDRLGNHDGLGHISLSNTLVLIAKSLYEPRMLKTSSLSHTRGSIVINHQKEGDGSI